MNIVQLQYKLRDMPLSAIQAAANGRFPDIPEMLATMELNRRERMEKAAAQPPTKSIKEQLEEKLTSPPQEQMGLPAMLQQAQQAGGPPQQDQVQQQMPQGAPQGMPQGVPQRMAQGAPQGMPQQPQQMREGGVAGLPTHNMFKRFDEGGIVAFAAGDKVESDKMNEVTAQLENDFQSQLAADQATPLPEDAQRAANIVRQMPFVQEAQRAIEANKVQVTTPEQEMERKQALLEKYGIRPPKEDELARIAASNAAYERDRQERAQYQGMKSLAEAARPNIHGRYMPGTIAGSTSSFGLSNLEVDRSFREANEKAQVAAKEAQREFKLGNLNDAIAAAKKSEEYDREAKKAVVTASAQMASYAMSATSQVMTNQESKRYHDMWKDIQDKDLKIKAAQLAQQAQTNIPEVFRNIDSFEKRYPDIAKTLTPEQKLELGVEISKSARGIPDRAETAYEQQVLSVNKVRQEAREKMLKNLQMQADLLASTGKDPEKLQKLRDEIKAKSDQIDRDNPYPPAPRSGISGLLGPRTPAPAASQTPAPGTVIRYDAQGRQVS